MNEYEQGCFDLLTRHGYTVLRRGWPDFLVIDKDQRRGFALELKRGQDKLSSDQTAMHKALARFGLLTRVWKEHDVKEYRKTHLRGRLLLVPEHLAGVAEALRNLEHRQHILAEEITSLRATVNESASCIEASPALNGTNQA